MLSPGIYARAFLEGRSSEEQLINFRRELKPGGGLSSYPHPWLMPDFWEFPTVSMGLGPIRQFTRRDLRDTYRTGDCWIRMTQKCGHSSVMVRLMNLNHWEHFPGIQGKSGQPDFRDQL